MLDAWVSRFAQTASTNAARSAESSFAQALLSALDQPFPGSSMQASLVGAIPGLQGGLQLGASGQPMGALLHEGGASGLGAGAAPDTPAAKSEYAALARRTAMEYGVNPALVQSVIGVESGYNPNAVSHAGAEGLMQLMPGTAAELGVANPMNPAENISGGVRYLRQMLERYDGNVPLALAAYNAGPGAVDRAGGIPNYTETRAYVAKVIHNWQEMTA
jgi:soluble lytic murein transglycosylase-like protein